MIARHFLLLLLVMASGLPVRVQAKDEAQIEIKFLVRGTEQTQKAVAVFELGDESETMAVAFFETPEITLFRQPKTAVILRARLKEKGDEDKGAKVTVKLRAGSSPLDASLVTNKKEDTKRERDITLKSGNKAATPTDSYSMDAKVAADLKPRRTIESGQHLKTLFTESQRELVETNSPGLRWKDLVVYGPVEEVSRCGPFSNPRIGTFGPPEMD